MDKNRGEEETLKCLPLDTNNNAHNERESRMRSSIHREGGGGRKLISEREKGILSFLHCHICIPDREGET